LRKDDDEKREERAKFLKLNCAKDFSGFSTADFVVLHAKLMKKSKE
jgi:hypothetical protein